MQLRLNPAHTLCQPSRNLLFATFGTGYGGQVLDLSGRPSHGMIADNSSLPSVGRSRQSQVPPGFPSDWQPLTFRSSTADARAEFGNVTKVTSVTRNYTAACWVRHHFRSTESTCAFHTMNQAVSGWLMVTRYKDTFLAGTGWMFATCSPGVVRHYRTNADIPDGEWGLCVATQATGDAALYTNGVPSALTYADSYVEMAAADRMDIGRYVNPTLFPANADIGPCMFWGSVLSADDIALLYRDTWGMVTRGTPLALRMAAARSAPAAESGGGIRRRIPFAGRFRPGMFRFLGGL